MLALFPPFVVMLIGLGAPPLLVVYSLACLANLTAGLTHYGTTVAPIVYAEGYVTVSDWQSLLLIHAGAGKGRRSASALPLNRNGSSRGRYDEK